MATQIASAESYRKRRDKGDSVVDFRHPMTPNFYCLFEQYYVVVSNNSIIRILYNQNLNSKFYFKIMHNSESILDYVRYSNLLE